MGGVLAARIRSGRHPPVSYIYILQPPRVAMGMRPAPRERVDPHAPHSLHGVCTHRYFFDRCAGETVHSTHEYRRQCALLCTRVLCRDIKTAQHACAFFGKVPTRNNSVCLRPVPKHRTASGSLHSNISFLVHCYYN